ncbi:MAG: enoyl-ACP reductase FabI [Hydrogenophaga sp.]|uniref:enoyl-ACP reductase FabI n=1 Tax=Hydrogenophaga sp. TaxID=1904254 RepID=UPI001E18DA51|nr:enoyl-ACP reductase FabI [Hydrogenophaga sp.]MBX3611071.1 enoyl-ACP reductase FabI [Hydrogenophaga sp.]
MDLDGRRGLVIGIANEHSIAFGCAQAFVDAGARLALTWLNDKAEPHVRPLGEALGADLMLACDVSVPGQLEAVFEQVARTWGRLDFVLHSIAFAPRDDLHAPLIDSSAEGFALAMDVSCHSFIRAARLALPLMSDGGALMTVSYYGAEHVVDHYNLMGPVKAALEASVRSLAVELAPRRVHVHALSAGPVNTRAASGIAHFDELIDSVRARTPGHQLTDLPAIGRIAAFLASDAGAPLTGSVTFADNGFHITA